MPTRTENALAYVMPSSSCDYHMYSFYPRTVREWNYLPQDVVQLGTPEAFRSALQSVQTGPGHSIATCSEWASPPIPEKPEVHLHFRLTTQILMLAKPSTQLTTHTHPSAGVFNPLKFALSHEEEVVVADSRLSSW